MDDRARRAMVVLQGDSSANQGAAKAIDEGNPASRQWQDSMRPACPCCGFLTLTERNSFENCHVCFWEDDGQDDFDADEIKGGPNGSLSLSEARRNFLKFGASDERLRALVRPPNPDEIP